MKKAVVATTAIIALAGLAVAAIPIVEHRAADNIKQQIESDGVTTVGSVKVGLFDRSVTLTNVRSTRDETVSAERWTVSGLAWPLGEVLRGHVPFGGWRLGDPLQAGRIEVTKLRVAFAAGQAWTVGSIAVDGLDLARYDSEIGSGPFRWVILGARTTRALAVRQFEEHDVAYTAPGTTNSVTIASISLENLAQGKLGAFVLSGFRVRGSNPGEEFGLDQMKIAGLDLERVLTSMSDSAWRFGRPLGRISLDLLRASGFGGEALVRRGLALDSVTIESTRQADGNTRARTRIDGFVFAPPLRGLETLQARVAMMAMGLKELRLRFDCSGIEDRKKGEVSVGPCALVGTDLGEIDLDVEFAQADAPFWQALDGGDAALLARSKVALASAKLVLADKGLLERWLKAVATASGQTPAVARSRLAQQVRQFQPAGVLITDDMTKLLDTGARFVEQGGTLTVECKPDPPLGLRQLSALATPGPDLINLLGVTATQAAPK